MVAKHLARYKTILWYQSNSRIIKQFQVPRHLAHFKQFRVLASMKFKLLFTLFQLISLIGTTCQDSNKTYSIGTTFITNDCSFQCTCYSRGMTLCRQLCTPNSTVCKVGERREDYEETIASSNCSCTKQRCLRGMLH